MSHSENIPIYSKESGVTCTTGEIAKLCGVTVRTVQYYDARGLLCPSELTEGGRRLYTEEDVKRLQVICMLREIGLSINVIGQLLREEDPGSVIDLLLRQRRIKPDMRIEHLMVMIIVLMAVMIVLVSAAKHFDAAADLADNIYNAVEFVVRAFCRKRLFKQAKRCHNYTAGHEGSCA